MDKQKNKTLSNQNLSKASGGVILKSIHLL